MQRVIVFLEKELARLDKQMASWMENSEAWKQQDTLLRTVPGVGHEDLAPVAGAVAGTGPAQPPPDRRAAAGLTPMACDGSGHWRGQRLAFKQARGTIRAALYLASWTAIRLPGSLRQFYHRLVEAGKPKQVALIAVARKLLLILNEMVRTNQPCKSPEIQLFPLDFSHSRLRDEGISDALFILGGPHSPLITLVWRRSCFIVAANTHGADASRGLPRLLFPLLRGLASVGTSRLLSII